MVRNIAILITLLLLLLSCNDEKQAEPPAELPFEAIINVHDSDPNMYHLDIMNNPRKSGALRYYETSDSIDRDNVFINFVVKNHDQTGFARDQSGFWIKFTQEYSTFNLFLISAGLDTSAFTIESVGDSIYYKPIKRGAVHFNPSAKTRQR